MSGEIQYVSDTILIEETLQALSGLNKPGMEKYAFEFNLASMLPSIGNEVSSLVGNQYRNSSDNSPLRTVENLLVPGIFFGIHPILGILVTIAEHYGYDIISIFNKIKDAILPDLKAGKQVSADKINAAAQAAIPATETAPEEGNADDLLYPLRAMRDEGQLTKEALTSTVDVKNNWLNPLQGLLQLYSARKRGSVIVGLLVWFLKTVLLSAGLLAVAGAVLPKQNPVTGQTPNNPPPQTQINSSGNFSSLISNVPASTGAGSYIFKKGPKDLWIEDLEGMQPYEMVLDWAEESYPILNQYTNIILSTPSFWNAVKSVIEEWRPGQKEISIPDPYKSRDDVIKTFIGDVFNAINSGRK